MTGPLHRLRVLDLTRALAGPYATMILADLGAEVYKIEVPDTGDFARQNPPFIDDVSAYFLSINRGKKSVTLNLKSQRGRALFLDLAASSDIVVENFRPGTMDRLGLSYDTLRERNPAIIYAACSGFGTDTEYSERGAYDIIIQAMAGTMSITGEPDGPPMRVGVSVGDIIGGMYAAVAILAAVIERGETEQGQAIEISLFNAQVALLENAFARYFATGEVAARMGSRHPAIATFGSFVTADGHIAMAAATEQQWRALCHTIERPDLIEYDRFASNRLRTANRQELDTILNEVFECRTTAEWIERLDAADVPCGPVNNVRDAAESRLFQESDMAVTVKHSRLGHLRVLNTPMRFSRTPADVTQASPDLGEHTREVLSELLHLDAGQLDTLEADDVI